MLLIDAAVLNDAEQQIFIYVAGDDFSLIGQPDRKRIAAGLSVCSIVPETENDRK
jgi:hypothetical protein